MNGDKIRMGVIGLGIGGWHAQAFHDNPDAQLAAICDMDEQKLASLGDQYSVATRLRDWRDLIDRDDVDAVSVCLPNYLHKTVAVAALQAGKHVLIEKPLALNPEEGEEILAAARASKRTAMVAMKFRYGAEAAHARSLVDSGRLGTIYYGVSTLILPYNGKPSLRPWFTNKETAGGGALLDNGVHLLDLHWYLAGRPRPVQAMGVCYSPFGAGGKAAEPGMRFDVEDFGAGLIRFDDGSAIGIESAWMAHSEGLKIHMRMYGTEGGLTLWPFSVLVEKAGKDEPLEVDLSQVQAEDQFTHFLRCIRTGEPPCSSIEDGLTVLRMLCALYRSAESGRSVDV